MVKERTAGKIKRWAVRESKNAGGWYWLFVGDKPRKPKGGWQLLADGRIGAECPKYYERFTPKCYHLKYGGGPVEIRFKDE